MGLLPSSPRRRRRLAWAAGVAVALGVAGAIVVAAPRSKPLPREATPAGTPAVPAAAAEREVALTPAMRRGITRTLERFLPAAVERRNPALAWELAGPGLRAGTTRKDWLAGRTPVFPFPVASANVADWRPAYSYADRVGFDLLLQARKETRRGPIAVTVDVVRRGERWLVDTWYISAVFTGPDERPFVTASPDFQAEASNKNAYERPTFSQAKLSPVWFAVPGIIVAALVLVPLAVLLVGRRRVRRAEAAYREASASR